MIVLRLSHCEGCTSVSSIIAQSENSNKARPPATLLLLLVLMLVILSQIRFGSAGWGGSDDINIVALTLKPIPQKTRGLSINWSGAPTTVRYVLQLTELLIQLLFTDW